MRKELGFTLIELLIVVAIIAILAAIAVPNFIEAQVRSKVARVKADMRTCATALEAYAVDWNKYPFDGANALAGFGPPRYNYWYIPREVSTPIAYVTSVIYIDPFRNQVASSSVDWQINNLRYMNVDSTYGPMYDNLGTSSPALLALWLPYQANYGSWRMNSAGPDRIYGERIAGTNTSTSTWPGANGVILPAPYDATNGSVSAGDVIRSQKSPTGIGNAG